VENALKQVKTVIKLFFIGPDFLDVTSCLCHRVRVCSANLHTRDMFFKSKFKAMFFIRGIIVILISITFYTY